MIVRGLQLAGRWSRPELQELELVLAKLPPAFLEKNTFLKVLERQDVLRDAPPEAPGHSMYAPERATIVLFNKGVYDGDQIDKKQFRRSIYHELAHTLLRLDPDLLKSWKQSRKGDGFVDSYARQGADEDFCDSFSEYLIDPEATRRAVPKKAQFLEQFLASANTREKTAMASLAAFTDELVKLAAPPAASMMQGMAARIPMMARLGLAGGVGAVAGHAIGKRKGEAQGMQESESANTEIAQKAFQMGVQRGALEMRNALMSQAGGQ